jgi:hypothetical protein
MYLYLCACIWSYPQDEHISFHKCICAKLMYVYVSCMYHVCMCFFACIWYVSCMCKYVYVLHVLAQTNTLARITLLNDLLQGPHHAGPTQSSDEQVPICFVPPSRTTCQTRFVALPRAARVEGVQPGFRVSPTGLPCALIHWWYLVMTYPSWSARLELGHKVMGDRCPHEKSPPNPNLTLCICIYICMYA